MLWRLTDLGVSMTGWRSVQYADLGRAPVAVGVGGAAIDRRPIQTGPVANDPAHAGGLGWASVLCLEIAGHPCYSGRMMERGNRSLGDVLIHLMDQISKAWNKPLKRADVLPRPQRFRYAFAGAFAWATYHLTDREWVNVMESFNIRSAETFLLVHALVGAWFAWLIAYQVRRCSPTRFFLEGILLPSVATALLAGPLSLLGLLGGGS